MKFIAATKCSLYPRRKLYRVSDIFEEGYNELINGSINLVTTCIAQTYLIA